MKQPKTCFQALSGSGKIDAENGIIYDVSVMTIGPALGHGIDIDYEGLRQCLDACLSHGEEGVRLMFDHDAAFQGIVGSIKNFKIIGAKLLGDAYLLETSPARNFVLELAQKMPSEFGLSVETTGEDEVVLNTKQKLYRCSEIDCIALVPKPAANPTGLFQKQTKTNMDEDQMKSMFGKMLAEALTPIAERLAKLEEGNPDKEATDEAAKKAQEAADAAAEAKRQEDAELEDGEDGEKQEEKLSKLASKAALEAVTAFAAKIGIKNSPKTNGEGSQTAKVSKFSALVSKFKAEGKKNPFAAAIAADPAAYNEHIEKLGGNW